MLLYSSAPINTDMAEPWTTMYMYNNGVHVRAFIYSCGHLNTLFFCVNGTKMMEISLGRMWSFDMYKWECERRGKGNPRTKAEEHNLQWGGGATWVSVLTQGVGVTQGMVGMAGAIPWSSFNIPWVVGKSKDSRKLNCSLCHPLFLKTKVCHPLSRCLNETLGHHLDG